MCLCTLLNAHLKVDAVAYDVNLGRLQVIEQVTVVPVVVAYGIFVLLQAFVHEFLVIDVTFSHTEGMIQIVAGDDGITDPCDVAQVVALTFFHLDKDVDVVLVDGPYGVFQNGCVAVAQFVILVDERLLGFIVTLRGIFLGLEEV